MIGICVVAISPRPLARHSSAQSSGEPKDSAIACANCQLFIQFVISKCHDCSTFNICSIIGDSTTFRNPIICRILALKPSKHIFGKHALTIKSHAKSASGPASCSARNRSLGSTKETDPMRSHPLSSCSDRLASNSKGTCKEEIVMGSLTHLKKSRCVAFRNCCKLICRAVG